jgi:hypothetical protein
VSVRNNNNDDNNDNNNNNNNNDNTNNNDNDNDNDNNNSGVWLVDTNHHVKIRTVLLDCFSFDRLLFFSNTESGCLSFLCCVVTRDFA